LTSATATFLFTDMEGSTQLLRANRGEYAAILAEHHRLLREAFAAHGGTEVDNQGDAFFVAFARAKDAVLAAADAQRAFASHTWPGDASVRVRMGVHTGEAQVAIDRYVGLSVHRAARISAVGHGGQVLVSPTTAGLLEDEDQLPGISLRDLGEHPLKDIERPVRLYQLEIDGLPSAFPALKVVRPPRWNRRRRVAVAATALVLVALAAGVILVASGGDAPPTVLPDSLVRIDRDTLEPTKVTRIGSDPDLVVAAGGFIWITNHVFRDIGPAGVRNAGDRTLTRVDPETDDVVTVGGGLAPCGIAADPSGDVWVANCFGSAPQNANVVRIDAMTLEFEATWPVSSSGGHFYRGLAYGGGSLWVAEATGGDDLVRDVVTELDPQTGKRRSIALPFAATSLAWSGGYGDLWISSFDSSLLMRLHSSTGDVQIVDVTAINPAQLVVDGETVWVGDWSDALVDRVRAVGPSRSRPIALPAQRAIQSVWNVAAGEGYVWAATPREQALWRIDPQTDEVTRIDLAQLPTGVATSDGSVWVVVRGP
jgi:class 3 adenylate cyclase/streptogramin lyase